MPAFPAVVPHLWLAHTHLARPPWKITLWVDGRAEAWFGCYYASRYQLESALLLAAMGHLHCSGVDAQMWTVTFSVTAAVGTAWFRYSEAEWVFEEYFPEDASA
jgi:hypothetical protein